MESRIHKDRGNEEVGGMVTRKTLLHQIDWARYSQRVSLVSLYLSRNSTGTFLSLLPPYSLHIFPSSTLPATYFEWKRIDYAIQRPFPWRCWSSYCMVLTTPHSACLRLVHRSLTCNI